jgi:4-amino-4-deoxy-L-arabinose transferase-like glycosyltransferase
MRFVSKKILCNRWFLDSLCIAFVIALNPITYFMNFSTRLFTPDVIAYATMGRDLFSKGLLYVPAWGHIDNGLILPPLYPFFIACGHVLFGEPLKVAEWVSSLSAICTIFPIYFYLKEISNRAVAVATTVLIGVNFYYFAFGMKPLSEATFLFFLSWCLFLFLKLYENREANSKQLAISVGVSSGLVFLSRQVGIIAFFVIAVLSLLQGFGSSKAQGRVAFQNFILISLGWTMVLAPYSVLLYIQTGQHPLKQKFQRGQYQVTTFDPAILSDIGKIENLTVEKVKQLENVPDQDQEYALVYAKRRFLRELLPDSSEMFAFLKREEMQKNVLFAAFFSVWGSPRDYLSRLYQNFIHLGATAGDAVLLLFVLSCLSPFLVKCENLRLRSRLILPVFIVGYLLAISCFTDAIPRYIYVLFPFVLMHVSGELFIGFARLIEAYQFSFSKIISFSVFYGCCLLITPSFFTRLEISPKWTAALTEFEGIRKRVNGDPVFGLTPLYTYLCGGSYRLLPNDSLKKVVLYGKKTGVRWLLVAFTGDAKSELTFYSNINWYWRPSLEEDYPGLVRYCCCTDDHMMALYEIL